MKRILLATVAAVRDYPGETERVALEEHLNSQRQLLETHKLQSRLTAEGLQFEISKAKQALNKVTKTISAAQVKDMCMKVLLPIGLIMTISGVIMFVFPNLCVVAIVLTVDIVAIVITSITYHFVKKCSLFGSKHNHLESYYCAITDTARRRR